MTEDAVLADLLSGANRETAQSSITTLLMMSSVTYIGVSSSSWLSDAKVWGREEGGMHS